MLIVFLLNLLFPCGLTDHHLATRNIAACSAQLLAVARTKTATGRASADAKGVIEKQSEALVVSSHAVLAAARDANNFHLANVMLDDIGNLSEMQAKKLIMSTQVEIMRLERALDG